jgi:hypothetical protein
MFDAWPKKKQCGSDSSVKNVKWLR